MIVGQYDDVSLCFTAALCVEDNGDAAKIYRCGKRCVARIIVLHVSQPARIETCVMQHVDRHLVSLTRALTYAQGGLWQFG